MQAAKPKRKSGKKKTLPAAETAADAAMQMLESKKLSDKINYSMLENLFNDDEPEAGPGPSSRAADVQAAFGDLAGLKTFACSLIIFFWVW